MIAVNGSPPPVNTLRFFDRLFPGIWEQWGEAAQAALFEIDAGARDRTVITSWFRSPNENRRAGGLRDSQHLVGLALDVEPGKGTSALAINEAVQIFRRFGFEAFPFEKHVHVQTFPKGVLRQVGILDALRL